MSAFFFLHKQQFKLESNVAFHIRMVLVEKRTAYGYLLLHTAKFRNDYADYLLTENFLRLLEFS